MPSGTITIYLSLRLVVISGFLDIYPGANRPSPSAKPSFRFTRLTRQVTFNQ
jgi:hypothetical protein